MKARLHTTLALALVALMGAPDRAAADEPEGAVTLQVRAPDAVDPQALRASLEQDLGVRVEIVRPDAEGEARVVVELTPEGTVRLRVRRDDGRPALTRETRPADDRERTTVTVGLLVSNLVRDESADVLELLRPEEPEPEPPTVVVGPPPLAEAPEPEAEPEPEPEAEPAPWIFAGVDFAPGVGVSSGYLGRERRALSLGVLGALTGGLDGVGLSSAVDLALGDVRGVQIAGVYAHGRGVHGVQLSGAGAVAEGRLDGVQIGGAASVAGPVAGGQLSGVASIAAGPMRGVQIGGAASVAGPVEGAQLSMVAAIAAGPMRGLQLGGAISAGGEVDGVQLSGVTAIAATRMGGLQLAPVNVVGGALSGAQLGVVNVAGEADGVQLGVTNVAGRVRGLQLGLFNVAEAADASIGLFSVNRRGHSHLRAEVDTNGFLGVSFVHRGPVTYSILSAAVEPFLSRPTGAFGIGIGARAQLADVFHLDFEALSHVLLNDLLNQDGPGAMFDARVLAGLSLLEGVTIYAGIGFRTHLSQRSDPEIGAPIMAFDTEGTRLRVRGWPALYGGVELF